MLTEGNGDKNGFPFSLKAGTLLVFTAATVYFPLR